MPLVSVASIALPLADAKPPFFHQSLRLSRILEKNSLLVITEQHLSVTVDPKCTELAVAMVVVVVMIHGRVTKILRPEAA
jgi:hypothetical protein